MNALKWYLAVGFVFQLIHPEKYRQSHLFETVVCWLSQLALTCCGASFLVFYVHLQQGFSMNLLAHWNRFLQDCKSFLPSNFFCTSNRDQKMLHLDLNFDFYWYLFSQFHLHPEFLERDFRPNPHIFFWMSIQELGYFELRMISPNSSSKPNFQVSGQNSRDMPVAGFLLHGCFFLVWTFRCFSWFRGCGRWHRLVFVLNWKYSSSVSAKGRWCFDCCFFGSIVRFIGFCLIALWWFLQDRQHISIFPLVFLNFSSQGHLIHHD